MALAIQRQDLLEKARLALLRLNPPSYGFADAALTEVYVALQVISVIAKIHPKSYRKRVTKALQEFFKDIRTPRLRQIDNQGNVNSNLIARLINDNLFHLDEFWLDEECTDFGADHTIPIEWMGYRIHWDEFDEMMDRLDELSRAGSFTIMMGIIWGNVDAPGCERRLEILQRYLSVGHPGHSRDPRGLLHRHQPAQEATQETWMPVSGNPD